MGKDLENYVNIFCSLQKAYGKIDTLAGIFPLQRVVEVYLFYIKGFCDGAYKIEDTNVKSMLEFMNTIFGCEDFNATVEDIKK